MATDVDLRMELLTHNEPPETLIAGVPADAYSMSTSLVVPVVEPTFTVPAVTSRAPFKNKSLPVASALVVLTVTLVPLTFNLAVEGMV